MTTLSLNSLKEKQTGDYKYMKLHCVHLERRIGINEQSSGLAEPHKSLKPTESWQMFLSKPCAEGTYFSLFPSLLILPTMLHFNGLCRKSMWDRLHSGRKWVWSSTNKHHGLTAAGPKVEISANLLTLTLFWAEGTLLRVIAMNMCFL